MISATDRVADHPDGEWIVSGSPAELAMITTLPLPEVPAQWLRQRWSRQQRWHDHSERILNHPTYLALHRWTTLAFPSSPADWSFIAAVLVFYAHRVHSGEWSLDHLRGRVALSLRFASDNEEDDGGRSRRQQNRHEVTDLLLSPWALDHLPASSCAPAKPAVESPVIDWLADVVGAGWLTADARIVLTEGMDLAAEFVASSSERNARSGLEALVAVAPANTTTEGQRLTQVLGHLSRPARDAIRCFVLGPTERTGVGGPTNSLIVWAASARDPGSVPDRLVAVWRYHAAMLDPQIASVASDQRLPRDRLRRFASRPGPFRGVDDVMATSPADWDRTSSPTWHPEALAART